MGDLKNHDYLDYGEDESMLDDDDIPEIESELEEEETNIELESGIAFRRTWRDTEKYKEMKELYKIINDDLYTGYLDDEFLEDNL